MHPINKIIPDNLLNPGSLLNNVLPKVKINRDIVTNIFTTQSLITVLFLINIGIIIDVKPSTINVLNILEPNTFPIVIPLLPSNDEIKLTASSGALVPSETIVKPTTIDGIPNFFAILEAPSTNISAPFISKINPIINNI